MMFVHPTATYTRNNKNFNHTSVPKYISFVITNFITSILDNLWEITNLNDEISTVNPRKFEKKKGWTDKMYPPKYIFFLRH